MTETQAAYDIARDAQAAAAGAGAAIRREQAEVRAATAELMDKLHAMNSPARPLHFWRAVLDSAWQRLGELGDPEE